MDRRAFITVMGGSMLAAPLVAEAQQAGKLPRIGLLGGSPPNSPGGRRAWEGFFQGLRELGYVEGQNILVEGRWYGERTDRLPALAGELVQLKVDVMLKVQPQLLEARGPGDFAGAFSAMARERAEGVIVITSSMFDAERTRIAKLAAASRVPTIYGVKEFAEAGGLMTYGVDVHESFRRAAGYVDKILKGAKPVDLPVEQPTKWELVINLKTAKTLGLTIPRTLLLQADQIIE